MNTPEERLRDAMRAAADTIAPGSAPPLKLPRPARRRRWAGWLTPLAAAAAVIAVVSLAEGLPRIAGAVTGGHPGGAALDVEQPKPPGDAAVGLGVPPYYVSLSYGNPDLGPLWEAAVRATASGRVLAKVVAPWHGTFTAVAAAADDRTFVLAEQFVDRSWVVPRRLMFVRLRFDPATASTRLTMLPVTVPTGARLAGLALSPDGTRLAMSLHVDGAWLIQVVSLSGTRARPLATYSSPAYISGLSWAPDGRRLAYRAESATPPATVGVLNTSAPSGSLAAHSTTLPVPARENALFTAAGMTIVGTGYPPGSRRAAIAAFPVAHGPAAARAVAGRLRSAPLIRYGKLTGTPQWIYWAGPGGRTLIVVAYFGLGGRGLVGVLRGDRFTPLPGSNQIVVSPKPPGVPAAW